MTRPIDVAETLSSDCIDQTVVVGAQGGEAMGPGTANSALAEQQIEDCAEEWHGFDQEEPGEGHAGRGPHHDHPDSDAEDDRDVCEEQGAGYVDGFAHGSNSSSAASRGAALRGSVLQHSGPRPSQLQRLRIGFRTTYAGFNVMSHPCRASYLVKAA
jgi:hypothetical protein